MGKEIATKVVARSEIEEFYNECSSVAWVYAGPFNCEGLMIGPACHPVIVNRAECHEFIPKDEIMCMVEEYVNDVHAERCRADRFIYDEGGKVLGVTYETV